jgi:hypothetical protein
MSHPVINGCCQAVSKLEPCCSALHVALHNFNVPQQLLGTISRTFAQFDQLEVLALFASEPAAAGAG